MGDRSTAPWILLLILGGYVLAALILFQLIAQIAILPFFDFSFDESIKAISNPYSQETTRLPLMIIQGITSLGTFILAPVFYSKIHLNLKAGAFLHFPKGLMQPAFMVVIIMFCFMVANSVVIEWNQNVDLPGFLSPFEEWAQAKEGQLEKLTVYLTQFNGVPTFLFGLIVIAVIPAIGEEFLFRGLIQNLINQATKNPHIAIWSTAFLFGVFHMQFYGLIPRMLLGALFGYLYYWSGHLSIAMIGHFINNGLTLFLLFLGQRQVIDFDPLANESSPPLYIIAIFFVVGTILLYLFRNYFKGQTHA
jgi:hypothetical protein